MKDPKEMAARTMARDAENMRRFAESENAVALLFGKYVSSTLNAGEDLSRESLRQWLNCRLETAKSIETLSISEALRVLDSAPSVSK